MLELGKPGSAGVGKGVLPVLRDDAVIATLRPATWKEAATAVIGDREWVLARAGRELVGRWASDPEGVARLRARQASFWRGTWEADLEGTPVQVQFASWWRGTRRYLVGERAVAESGITGGWSPRSTLTVNDSLPLAHQVFLLWLERVITRRSQAAAIGGGAAAAAGAS